jgi:hypothetical protein
MALHCPDMQAQPVRNLLVVHVLRNKLDDLEFAASKLQLRKVKRLYQGL